MPPPRIVALDRAHLLAVIAKEMEIHGSRCCLNHIDVSHVTDMKGLFAFSEFNGDISMWNTASVLNMHTMFCESMFNGDISQWNVSRVKSMHAMFAASSFNGDISRWDVSNVKEMAMMFYASSFVQDISGWNVSPKADIDRLCREHAPLLAMLRMTRWVLRLHVAEKWTPEEPVWAQAFNEVAPLAHSMQLSLVEYADTVYQVHRRLTGDEARAFEPCINALLD